MKKTKLTRLVRMIITIAIAIVLFTGCGEEEQIDYRIEGIPEQSQSREEENGGKSGLAQFEAGEIWKDVWYAETGEQIEWEGQLYDQRWTVDVNATIRVPQTEQMSVVEVKEVAFDREFKETIAGKIFDSGEIYYGDIHHLPKKDLQELKAYYEEAGGIYIPLEYASREEVQQEVEEIYAVLDNIDSAGETYTLAQEYAGKEYIGSNDGRLYTLKFEESEGNIHNERKVRRITWEIKDLAEVCPEELKEKVDLVCSPWMRGDWAENQCEISEEEALKEAKAFVDRLGLDYPVVSYTRPLVWGTLPDTLYFANDSEAWGINGYVFSFDLGVDDISFVNYGMEEDYEDFYAKTEDNEEKQYSLNARLQIYITDQGIIKVIVDNPMEIIRVSEGVELLPLDAVKGIMKQTVEKQWELLRLDDSVSYHGFNEMELIYFRVRNQENPGEYSYVPTWRLGNVTRDPVLNLITIKYPVLVNAIDGSVIYFFEEM